MRRSSSASEGRKVLLTFGLIGPGKGIEHAIQSLPQIIQRHPEVVYIILGATHPHLLASEGERYRLSLEWLAEEQGVKDHLIFDNRFVSPADLKEFISATDIYLTPYLNREQITSGTLAQVFGAGRAVVSTPYRHAEELLVEGRGKLVPFASPAQIAEAVCEYLDQPDLLQRTQAAAWQAGREMIWPAVAARYLETFQQASLARRAPARTAFAGWTAGNKQELPHAKLDHLVRMTDSTGIFQHAIYTVPDFHHGYCTDDNARAFILCCLLDDLGGHPPGERAESALHHLPRLPLCLVEPRHWRLPQFHELRPPLAGARWQRGQPWPCALGAGHGISHAHHSGAARALCTQLFDARPGPRWSPSLHHVPGPSACSAFMSICVPSQTITVTAISVREVLTSRLVRALEPMRHHGLALVRDQAPRMTMRASVRHCCSAVMPWAMPRRWRSG